jgi:hypothetical protein
MAETRAALAAANEVDMASSQVSGHFPEKQDYDDIISESGSKAMSWSIGQRACWSPGPCGSAGGQSSGQH